MFSCLRAAESLLHNLADKQFSNSGFCIFSLSVHDIDQGICSILQVMGTLLWEIVVYSSVLSQ